MYGQEIHHLKWLSGFLVDCYKTKAMYILPPNKYNRMKKILSNKKMKSSEIIFKKIKKDLNGLKLIMVKF